MNLNEIKQLAEQSKGHVDMGKYANMRVVWAYDPINKNQHMWWGKEQPYYKFTYLLTNKYPGIYLEIGTHRGINFACAAAGQDGLDNRFAIGIDVDRHHDAVDVGEQYPNGAKFIHGSSISPDSVKEVENICAKTKSRISIIMIDACHKKSWVESEIKAYKHLFADEVIIMMDDIIFADNNTYLAPMFHELPGQKVTFPNLHTDNRVGVILTSFNEYKNWDPGTYSPEDMERGYRIGYKPSITSWGDGYK